MRGEVRRVRRADRVAVIKDPKGKVPVGESKKKEWWNVGDDTRVKRIRRTSVNPRSGYNGLKAR